MMDTRMLLERQAAWQKRRAALSWPEKVRRAQAVREWAAQFSRAQPKTTGAATPKPAGLESNLPARGDD